jgi:hypothetical protein
VPSIALLLYPFLSSEEKALPVDCGNRYICSVDFFTSGPEEEEKDGKYYRRWKEEPKGPRPVWSGLTGLRDM